MRCTLSTDNEGKLSSSVLFTCLLQTVFKFSVFAGVLFQIIVCLCSAFYSRLLLNGAFHFQLLQYVCIYCCPPPRQSLRKKEKLHVQLRQLFLLFVSSCLRWPTCVILFSSQFQTKVKFANRQFLLAKPETLIPCRFKTASVWQTIHLFLCWLVSHSDCLIDRQTERASLSVCLFFEQI